MNLSKQRISPTENGVFECGAFDWNYVHKMFEVEGVAANIEVRADHLEVAKEFIRTKDYLSFYHIFASKGTGKW